LQILENSGRYWNTSIYQYLYQYCRGRIPVNPSFYVYIILKELNTIPTHTSFLLYIT
jgi:hypothetical protein